MNASIDRILFVTLIFSDVISRLTDFLTACINEDAEQSFCNILTILSTGKEVE
jgi:hypothetical protein